MRKVVVPETGQTHFTEIPGSSLYAPLEVAGAQCACPGLSRSGRMEERGDLCRDALEQAAEQRVTATNLRAGGRGRRNLVSGGATSCCFLLSASLLPLLLADPTGAVPISKPITCTLSHPAVLS